MRRVMVQLYRYTVLLRTAVPGTLIFTKNTVCLSCDFCSFYFRS